MYKGHTHSCYFGREKKKKIKVLQQEKYTHEMNNFVEKTITNKNKFYSYSNYSFVVIEK